MSNALTPYGYVSTTDPLQICWTAIHLRQPGLTADAFFAWIDTCRNGILCDTFASSPSTMRPFNPHRDTPDPGVGVQTSPIFLDVAAGQHLRVAVRVIAGVSPVPAGVTVAWPEHFARTVHVTVTRLAAQRHDADSTVNESNCLYLCVGAEKLVQRAVNVVGGCALEGSNR